MVWRTKHHTNKRYSPNHRRIFLFQSIRFLGCASDGAGVLWSARVVMGMGGGQFRQFLDRYIFMRLLRPASLYSLDDSLRCVNRKMGFATKTLNIVEQYQYILQDLGAKVIDTQYIVPLPAEFPSAALSPQILFNPYASRKDKGLSPSRATAALQAIADEFPGHSVGILCSPTTLHSAQHLESAVARDNVAVLRDGLTPEKVAGYICRAQAVVSVDIPICMGTGHYFWFHDLTLRFIPIRMGNSVSYDTGATLNPVYPHTYGEQCVF